MRETSKLACLLNSTRMHCLQNSKFIIINCNRYVKISHLHKSEKFKETF